MAGIMIFYYGLDGSQLVVIFVAAALVFREASAGPATASPPAAPAVRPRPAPVVRLGSPALAAHVRREPAGTGPADLTAPLPLPGRETR